MCGNKRLYIMNRMLLNNEIICTVLRIHQRYFSSDKHSVEIFNAYMQKVNLKFYNFQFILLTFLFRARCLNRKFHLQDLWSCALAWWCQKSHHISHTHTCHLLNTSLTIFFRHSQFTRDILAASLSRSKLTKVCWVLFQSTDLRHHFQYICHEEESRVATWYFLSPSRNE
jgi:hypothetical protein